MSTNNNVSENSSDTTWKSSAGFIWSLIGSAVGFANILSFSAGVYKNGGGAFLIPYCLALFLLGIPLLILEGFIGNSTRSPLVSAFGTVLGKTGRTLGWLAVIACLTIGGFYIVLTGYSVAYTYFSAVNAISVDSKSFFIDTFLKTTPSISEFGAISMPILIATLLVISVAWYVMAKNVKDGVEKICSIFMPILVVIMTSFAIIVSLLPGGFDGWTYYLKPDFSKLLDPSLWRDVFGQLFFSLSLGLGIIVGYSRHTDKTINIPKAMMYVAIGDFAVSFISGAAIFGCLAHISYIQGVPFDAILRTDSTFEIGFIIFPQIFKTLGPIVGQLVGVIFFFCLFIAGITGVFSIIESIAGNVEVEFKLDRKKAVTYTLLCMGALSIIFCMGNSSYLIDALAPMVMGTNMLIGGLALIVIFRFGNFYTKLNVLGFNPRMGTFYKFILTAIIPSILLIILTCNLLQEFQSMNIEKTIRWIWFVFAMTTAWSFAHFSNKRSLVVVN